MFPAKLVGAYTNDWFGACPDTDQPVELFAASSVQDTPDPAGRPSDTLNPLAVPAPEFCNVTVNPICCPADTLPASALFEIVTAAQLTVSEAGAEPDPSFEVWKLAVLS